MGQYIVKAIDEDSGALMGAWVFSDKEYSALLKFIDSGGPSQ